MGENREEEKQSKMATYKSANGKESVSGDDQRRAAVSDGFMGSWVHFVVVGSLAIGKVASTKTSKG